jgi:putative MATE family efflux protein
MRHLPIEGKTCIIESVDMVQTIFKPTPGFFKIVMPLFIELALAVIVSYLATYFISQYSDRVMGSISVANQFLNMLLLIFQVISGGAGILMAQAVGANANQTKNKIFTVSLLYGFLLGVLGMIFFLTLNPVLFSFFTLSPDVLESARTYAIIISLFFPIQSLSLIMTQMLYAHGATRIGVIGNSIAAIVQLSFMVLFLYGHTPLGIPELGVAGVAIGWVTGRMVYVIFATLYVFTKIKLRFQWSAIRQGEKGLTRKLFGVGFPSTLEHITYTLMMIVITALVTSFDAGTTSIIAKGYFDNLAQFTYFFTAAVSGAIAILIGQQVGARQYDAAEKTTSYGILVAMVSSLVPSFLFILIMGFLASLFTQDEAIISLMQSIIIVDIFLEVGRALNMIFGRALKSSGDAYYPLWVGIVIEWGLAVPLAFYFGQTLGLGLVGVWIALAIDELVRGCLNYLRWRSRRWHTKGIIQTTIVKDPSVRILK